MLLGTALSWWLLAAPSQAANQPTASTLPTISGTPQVGQTLSEGHATWSVAPYLYTYQWEDCNAAGQRCTPIDAASNQTYVVTESDLGDTLRVEETAFSWAGADDVLSDATTVVSGPPSPIARGSSTTSLSSPESGAVTDQIVSLVATVTSSSSALAPSGTLTFADRGAPISGCQNKPVLPTGQSVTLFCQTSFAAAVQQLTAVFTPSPGSVLAGSASAPESFAVIPEPSTTSLTVSGRTVRAGSAATFLATVTPSNTGPMKPSQSVEFLDFGRPIPACASRPAAWAGAASTATCTITYTQPGEHLITARYSGDGNFASSTSSPAELVDAVAGRIHPVVSWTFYYNPAYTEILALTVQQAPRNTTVLVSCAGTDCPFATRAVHVVGSASSGAADLSQLFASRHLRPGTTIAVSVRRPGWIGKRYTFKIRAAHPPRLVITCHAAGIRPGVGC